jgi:hypothetical protein
MVNKNFLGVLPDWIIIFVVLDFILKGFALWRSAKRGQKWWFIALFVINSLGILPVIYLLTHPKNKKDKEKK